MRQHKFAPSYMRYRDYPSEKHIQNLPETKEERIKRILDSMPNAIFNNPQLRLQALRKAFNQ